jgi:hypothetical protein
MDPKLPEEGCTTLPKGVSRAGSQGRDLTERAESLGIDSGCNYTSLARTAHTAACVRSFTLSFQSRF